MASACTRGRAWSAIREQSGAMEGAVRHGVTDGGLQSLPGEPRRRPGYVDQMRSVLITGTSSGIGEATALRLDRAGMRVFAGVRNPADGEALTAKASDRLHPVQIDITDDASVAAAAEEIADVVGDDGLWGLVNNAGAGYPGPMETISIEDLRAQLEVNLVGHVRVTQALLPLLRAANGRLVFVGSVGGRIAFPFAGPYHMTKFAMEALADVWRQELHPDSIEVSLIEPGRDVHVDLGQGRRPGRLDAGQPGPGPGPLPGAAAQVPQQPRERQRARQLSGRRRQEHREGPHLTATRDPLSGRAVDAGGDPGRARPPRPAARPARASRRHLTRRSPREPGLTRVGGGGVPRLVMGAVLKTVVAEHLGQAGSIPVRLRHRRPQSPERRPSDTGRGPEEGRPTWTTLAAWSRAPTSSSPTRGSRRRFGRLGPARVKAAVAAALARCRAGELSPADVVTAALDALPESAGGLRPVINATGVVVHTNLGRAPLSAAAREALDLASGATDVELDLSTGRRDRRGRSALAALARAVPDAEDVLVVNNGAAALSLVAHALWPGSRRSSWPAASWSRSATASGSPTC